MLNSYPSGKYLFKVNNRDTKKASMDIAMLPLLSSKYLPTWKYQFYPFTLTFFRTIFRYVKNV